jgi:hypothetical protein
MDSALPTFTPDEAVGIDGELRSFHSLLPHDALDRHAGLPLIENEGLRVKDAPATSRKS